MCFTWRSESSYAISRWWRSIIYPSVLSSTISGPGSSTSNCSNGSHDAGSMIREINTPQRDCKWCFRKTHTHADAHFILHLLPFFQPHSLSLPHTLSHTGNEEEGKEWSWLPVRQRGFSCNLACNQKASAGSGGCISSPNAESHSLPSLLDIKESFTKHLSF